MAHENNINFNFQCPNIKFYWNTSLFIHLPTSIAVFAL